MSGTTWAMEHFQSASQLVSHGPDVMRAHVMANYIAASTAAADTG